MHVRLVIATVSEESTVDDLLSYVEGTAMPSFDGQEGLMTFAAMKVSDSNMLTWTTWKNKDARDAADEIMQQAVSGAKEFLAAPPEVLEGELVASQMFMEEHPIPFYARFVVGAGVKEGKTYEDVAEWLQSSVYTTYQSLDGIIEAAGVKVDATKGFSYNFWTDETAYEKGKEVVSSVTAEAVENLIESAPTEHVGECSIWKTYPDFGKL